MAVARPYGFEIDFVRNPISGSAAWFVVIILKFTFAPIFEIKIYEEKFLFTKKISFAKPRQYLTPPAWELSSLKEGSSFFIFLTIIIRNYSE